MNKYYFLALLLTFAHSANASKKIDGNNKSDEERFASAWITLPQKRADNNWSFIVTIKLEHNHNCQKYEIDPVDDIQLFLRQESRFCCLKTLKCLDYTLISGEKVRMADSEPLKKLALRTGKLWLRSKKSEEALYYIFDPAGNDIREVATSCNEKESKENDEEEFRYEEIFGDEDDFD